MSKRRPPKRLSSEDLTLWRKVVEKATPLADRPLPPALQKPKVPPDEQNTITKVIPPFSIGQNTGGRTANRTAVAFPPLPDRPAPRMDSKAYKKLTRGKLSPDARIDLHGMTLDQAHSTLVGFLLSAHAKGHRLVLVITGKGKTKNDRGPIPTPVGVLRHHVPQWLASGALGHVVLEVSEAHRRHGGSGAYYVYLRRRR